MKIQWVVLSAGLFFLLPVFSVLSEDEHDPLVYIARMGKEYHKNDCQLLKDHKIPIKLSNAVYKGFEPCGVCIPPPPETLQSQSAEPQQNDLYRVNVANLRSFRQACLCRMMRARVIDHVDADTVFVEIPNPPEQISNYEKIQILGVDIDNPGKEAKKYTENRLSGEIIYLAFDIELRDKFDSLLAYVYLPDGSCHNANLIRNGYARARTEYTYQFIDEFRFLEMVAKENRAGIWK